MEGKGAPGRAGSGVTGTAAGRTRGGRLGAGGARLSGWVRGVEHAPEPTVHQVGRVVVGLLVLGIGGFLIDGADRPANPHLVQTASSPSRFGLAGFATVSLTITPGPGLHAPASAPCALTAVSTAQQDQGLMNQTSLHGYAGMAFPFPRPTTVSFYMKNTIIPLTVAWFDDRGMFVGSKDMPPCPATVVHCPTYASPKPYGLALEVPAGGLRGLGLGPGSTLILGGACAPG